MTIMWLAVLACLLQLVCSDSIDIFYRIQYWKYSNFQKTVSLSNSQNTNTFVVNGSNYEVRSARNSEYYNKRVYNWINGYIVFGGNQMFTLGENKLYFKDNWFDYGYSNIMYQLVIIKTNGNPSCNIYIRYDR